MTYETKSTALATALGTDYKTFRTFLTGSSIGAFSLATTAQDVKAAISELKDSITAAAAGMPSDATTGARGVGQIATTAQLTAGTDDFSWVTSAKLAAKLSAWAQPLNTNLTNLAGVTNTAYGRAFLALANQAGLMALLPASSDTVVGVQRNATQAETNAGTNDATQITPLKLQTRMAAFAVPLTYLDTDGALAANSDTKVATQKAVKAYADALIGANDAMVFKGVLDASANPNYPASNRGDTYKISVGGKVGGAAGIVVEPGDMIVAITDGTAAGTQAAVGAQWTVIQANIDGAVIGPASSTAANFATFSGSTGKVIQDSGLSLDTNVALGTSDTKIPSQKAVKAYGDNTFATLAATGNLDVDLVAAYTAAKA